MKVDSTNGDSGKIGANDDNGFIGTNGVIGTKGTIEWRCVLHISQTPLHIEINDVTGVIGAISIIDTNGINDANESPFAPTDCQCC